MTEAIYTIPINKNGQELLQRGTPLFPCAIYDRDIHLYITNEISPHWHQELEILILEEGCVHVSLIDQEFDLHPGEGYITNSNTLHGVFCRSDGPCRYRSIVFDPSIMAGSPGSAFDVLYVRPFTEQGAPVWILRPQTIHDFSTIIELFYKSYYACETKSIGYEFIVREALSNVLLLLNENKKESPYRPAAQQELRMKQMLSWIDEHYSEPITVSQLADVAGICVRECQRSFSNFLHTSPMQYLTRRRISTAVGLLSSTDLPIIEIGMQCGFDNPSYFSKQFKEITGLTPREYRNTTNQ